MNIISLVIIPKPIQFGAEYLINLYRYKFEKELNYYYFEEILTSPSKTSVAIIIFSILTCNKNNEAISCLKYLNPNLYFSDTGGNIFIFNSTNKSIIYNYMPHEPQKENTNLDFGSLSIKSEVWSFLVHELNNGYLYIITCSEDQSVKIWKIKLNTNKDIIIENILIKEIKEHKYAVTCLDWIYNETLKKDLLNN